MNANLIPSYDMLGLPAPPWLVQVLMALTLALHWAFLGVVVGGMIVVLLNGLRVSRQPGLAKVNGAIVPFFPFSLSMAMTMGIAPLLFVQVLYGNLFYTSNILLGFWWLAIVPLVIVNFYLLRYAWQRAKHGRPQGLFLSGLIIVIFVAVAVVLSSNATLTQAPEAWGKARTGGGSALYLGDGALIPRLLFALTGLIAAGGIFVALFSQAGLVYDDEAGPQGVTGGLGIALPALIVQLICGVVLICSLPAAQRGALFGSALGAVLTVLTVLAFVATIPLVIIARRAATLLSVALPGFAYFVGLFALAAVRDSLRRAAIAPQFKLSSMPVHAQWDSFLLFLVVFLAGLGVVAYLVKLACTPKLESA